MKIAITCDTLIKRDHYTEIVELICETFPDSKIYCFVHKEGAILGPIEQRQITSSYLSQVISSNEEFYTYSHRIPALAENLFVSCEYELIINITNGFSQGFKKCQNSKIISYVYDFSLGDKIRRSLIQKIFFPFVSSWAIKKIYQSDLILLSNDEVLGKHSTKDDRIKVISPPFKVSDFGLFPQKMFDHNFFLFDSENLSLKNAREIINWFREWGLDFKFVGEDAQLSDLKSSFGEKYFLGTRCSGELAPIFASSIALISFNIDIFPKAVLSTLSTGRPVIVSQSIKKWVNGDGCYFTEFNKQALKTSIDEVIRSEDGLDPQKNRANVMKYHDVKFKTAIKREVEKMLGIKISTND